MTSDLCSEDVVVRITAPQIITSQTLVPGGGATGAGARVAASSAAVELGRRLLLAARAGDTPLVLDLMAKGAPFTTDWLGTSPLHLAAGNAHADTCAVLLRAGVSRDARSKVERTPLHLAACAGHARVLRLLLDAGAAVDVRDMLRMTPLHWAVQNGHAQAAAELLRAGADPAALNKFHKTPHSLALQLRRDDLRGLIEDALKDREAARSVSALVDEQMAETATEEPQIQTFEAVQRIQDLKPTKPMQTEKAIKQELNIEVQSATPGGGAGAALLQQHSGEAVLQQHSGAGAAVLQQHGGAGAALLRRHGITLLPADHGGTVLSALQSGRTVVLSDAGKLMLKESETSPPTVSKMASIANQAKGMVLTATPVKSPPKPGVKIFTLNNKLLAVPKDNKIPIKKIINPQDMQVKFVQLPADTKIISPSKIVPMKAKNRIAPRATAPTVLPNQRPAVKIIMNKSNFNRLIATASRSEHSGPEVTVTSDPSHSSAPEGDAELAGASGSPGMMRAQLAGASGSPGIMRAQLAGASVSPPLMRAQLAGSPGMMRAQLASGSDSPGMMRAHLTSGSDSPGMMRAQLGNGSDSPGIMRAQLAVGSDSPGVLRAQLAAAQRSLLALRRELKSTRERLAQYERVSL